MKKFITVSLAMAMCLSMTTTAFAAAGGYSGRGSGNRRVHPSAVGGSGGFSSSASAATTAQVTAAVEAALKSGSNSITLKNKGLISLATMQAAAALNPNLVINADTVVDGQIVLRMFVNPALATKNINLSGSTTSKGAVASKALFEKHFGGKFASISLGQQDDFGMSVSMAAKLDVAGMDAANLKAYAYNASKNTYKALGTATVDANGFVHFTTPAGGYILVSDKAL